MPFGPSGTALAGLSDVFSAPCDDGDVSWWLACWWLGGGLAVAWRWLVVPMGVGAHGTHTVALPHRHASAKPGVPGLAGTGGGAMAGWLESTTGIPSRGRSTGRNACAWMAKSKSTCAVSALAQQPPTSGTLPGFGTPCRFVRKSPGSRRRLSSESSEFPMELESVLRN